MGYSNPDLGAAAPEGRGLLARLRRRYFDVLGSIYIYNEHRGYTALDRVLEAVLSRFPDDEALVEAVERHRADEAKHYVMFRRWFERRGTMPFALGRAYGHIDRFIEILFRTRIDDLDTFGVVACDEKWARLCRIISLTERRGHRQVEILLRSRLVRRDRVLTRIFEVIEKDEPSHWAPYEGWLSANAKLFPRLRERAIDAFIHSELLMLKLPLLFLAPRMRRHVEWPDAGDPAESRLDPHRPAMVAGA